MPAKAEGAVGRLALLGGVFLVSLATLHLELLHTRLLSFSLWQSVVYAVITLALLGFGISGAVLASFPWLRENGVARRLGWFSLGFCITTILGLAIAVRIPIDCFAASKLLMLKLSLLFLLLTLPYCFAGGIVALALASFKEEANRIYFANMVGSGAGCLAFICTISALGGQRSLFLVAVLGTLAGVFFSWKESGVLRAALAAVMVLVGTMGILAPASIVALRPDPNKALARWTDPDEYPDATIEFTGWSPISRVDVVCSPSRMKGRFLDGTEFSSKLITTDGDATTWMPSGLSAEEMEEHRKEPSIFRNFRTLAYVAKRDPKVLLIGVGGGVDARQALLNGANPIVALDINPIIMRLVQDDYRAFNGGLFHRPEIIPIVGEGRSFVRTTDDMFDVIHMHGVDTFAALSSGAYVLAEHYLYTVEAFGDYFDHLEEDGILSIARFAFDYPRESLKLCATAVVALQRIGVKDVGQHIYVVKGTTLPWATLLCKKEPFSAEEQRLYDVLFQEVPFRVMYKPGMEAGESGVPVGPDGNYVRLIRSAQNGTLDTFCKQYRYDIQPATDDHPFFFKYYQWDMLGTIMTDGTGWAGAEGPLGLLILASLIVATFLGTLLLIFAPLWKFNRDGLKVPRSFRFLIYFLCLGMGFMFIEIAFLQRFVLFLGHPIYSITVILFAMLVFSGVGSFLAGELKVSRRRIVSMSVLGIVVLVLLYMVALRSIFNAFLGYPIAVRALISVLLVAPLAMCMGMPFPTGLRAAGEVHPALVAWACGVNGSSSVFSSIIAIVIAMIGGFSSVLALSTVVYALGAVSVYPILAPAKLRDI